MVQMSVCVCVPVLSVFELVLREANAKPPLEGIPM